MVQPPPTCPCTEQMLAFLCSERAATLLQVPTQKHPPPISVQTCHLALCQPSCPTHTHLAKSSAERRGTTSSPITEDSTTSARGGVQQVGQEGASDINRCADRLVQCPGASRAGQRSRTVCVLASQHSTPAPRQPPLPPPCHSFNSRPHASSRRPHAIKVLKRTISRDQRKNATHKKVKRYPTRPTRHPVSQAPVHTGRRSREKVKEAPHLRPSQSGSCPPIHTGRRSREKVKQVPYLTPSQRGSCPPIHAGRWSREKVKQVPYLTPTQPGSCPPIHAGRRSREKVEEAPHLKPSQPGSCPCRLEAQRHST